MADFQQKLNRDADKVRTSARYSGDKWVNDVEAADGALATIGQKADPEAGEDLAQPQTGIGLWKGMLAALRSIVTALAGVLGVQLASPLPAGNNNIGDVDVASMPAVTQGAPGAQPWPVSLSQSSVVETTHHNAATVDADGTDVNVEGLSTAGLQITGTSTSRTVKFQGSVDGNTFFDVQAVNYSSGTVATSTTANDAWQVDVRGLAVFRARLDAVAGGNVTVISKVVA